ncbi:hypothetical protein GGI43DRAFT_362546 [Trichoderma evansii]
MHLVVGSLVSVAGCLSWPAVLALLHSIACFLFIVRLALLNSRHSSIAIHHAVMPRASHQQTQTATPSRPNGCNSPLIFSRLNEDRSALDDGPKRAPPPHMPRRIFSPTTFRGPDEGAQKGIA